MAAISDLRLATDMTRAMGRSLVRAGVNMLLQSNNTAENDQSPLIRCRACDGEGIMEVPDGDLDNLKGHPYWGKYSMEVNTNGKEAGTAPSSDGRGRPAVDAAVTIGETLHSFIVSQGLTSGKPWQDLVDRSKQGYEIAADYFLDHVRYYAETKPDTDERQQINLLNDEVDGLSLSLTQVREALKTVGARQNCDSASAIISFAEKYEHEIQNNNRGFDNILNALKESGAVVDYGNPLQAARDIAAEFRSLSDMYRSLSETLRDIRDEVGEVVDTNDMETVSAVKRLVQVHQQRDRAIVNERTDAVVRTLGQMKSYIEATMQNVEKQRAATP